MICDGGIGRGTTEIFLATVTQCCIGSANRLAQLGHIKRPIGDGRHDLLQTPHDRRAMTMIAGQRRALPDPERVSLSQAARISGVSHRTIERLVEAGLLKCEQVTPRAPWEVRRSDLDAEPIRRIIDRLHRTGKLILQGGCAEDQLALFTENQGDDNARHHE